MLFSVLDANKVLNINKVLVTNKIGGIEGGGELMIKFIEPKTRKFSKSRKTQSQKSFKS